MEGCPTSHRLIEMVDLKIETTFFSWILNFQNVYDMPSFQAQKHNLLQTSRRSNGSEVIGAGYMKMGPHQS